jgi:hypothetical protein
MTAPEGLVAEEDEESKPNFSYLLTKKKITIHDATFLFELVKSFIKSNPVF